MASTPAASLRPPVISTEVLTDEQCQRILALRTAREVLEVRSSSQALSSGGTDVKETMLLFVAQWVISGDLPGILQLVQGIEDAATRAAAVEALGKL